MKSFSYVIQHEAGLHARPAGLIVKECTKFSSVITLKTNGKSADAKRVFAIMGLGIKQGDTVELEADGTDEEAAIESMEKFLKENL